MRVWVLSKQMFNNLMVKHKINDNNVEKKTECCFISINNLLTESPKTSSSYFSKDHTNVLRLHFDDVDEDLYEVDYVDGKLTNSDRKRATAMSEVQAKQIVDFLETQKSNKVNQCFVHCTAGISRSGAVGAFVSDYFGESYIRFRENNPHICENGHVLRLLNRELRNR